MNIYLYLDERGVIRDVIVVSHKVISPNYIEYHEQDMTLIGKVWDRETSTTAANPYPEPIIVTRLAFRSLFTLEEKVDLYIEAKTDTVIQVFLDDIAAAQEVDLTYPPLIRGIQYLVYKNIISENRAMQILGNVKVE